MMTYSFRPSLVPLFVSMPHIGTCLPDEIAQQMLPIASELADTDWYLAQVYAFLDALGIGSLQALCSRYVVDLNRAPEPSLLYPGQNNTGLVPLTTFTGQALYAPDSMPDEVEIRRRTELYWQPYHQKLLQELMRLQKKFGYVVLWDAHSICSTLPWLFSGQLRNLNLGTVDGASIATELMAGLPSICHNSNYSWIIDGRFKGGYITRHYGVPEQHIHAIQMEMTWSTYLHQESSPYTIHPDKLKGIQTTLQDLISQLLAASEQFYAR